MSLIVFFQILTSTITLFLVGLSIYTSRYDLVIYKLKTGRNCYICGSLNPPQKNTSDHTSFFYTNPILCKSCKRDVMIDKIDNKIKSIFNQIKYYSLNILNREGVRDYRKTFSFIGAILVLVSIPAIFITPNDVFKILIMMGNTCTSISLLINLSPALIINLKLDDK